MRSRLAVVVSILCLSGCSEAVASGNGAVASGYGSFVPAAVRNESVRNALPCRGTRVGKGIGWPAAIAVDLRGNVFVADTSRESVYEVSPPFTAPSFGTMRRIASGFSDVIAITVSRAGDVFVADAGRGIIEEIAPGGRITQVGPHFSRPIGVAASGAKLYAIEAGNRDLIEISPPFTGSTHGQVKTYSDIRPSASDTSSLAADDLGNAYMAFGTNTFETFFPSGSTAIAGPPSNYIYSLTSVAVISTGRENYFIDTGGNSIDEWIAHGGGGWALHPICDGLTLPNSIAVDNKYNVYYSDLGGVHEVTP